MEQLRSKLVKLAKTQPDLVIFGIFVFLLPFGTRHFLDVLLPYSDQVFNFWTAAFLYLSDILLVIILILWLIRIFRRNFVFPAGNRLILGCMLGLALVVVFSALLSLEPRLSWYGVMRWGEVFVLCAYTLSVIVTWRRRFMVCALFFAAMSVQAIIAVLQFLTQQSLGLKLLGESVLSTAVPNVAEIVANNQTWLRAYGTQPHPNVLGYLLVISLILAVFMYARVKSTNWRIAISALAGLQVMALVMTFSRTAWMGLLFGISTLIILCLVWRGPRPYKDTQSLRAFGPLFITAFVILATLISLWPLVTSRIITNDANGDMAASYRHELDMLAWDRFAAHPIIGIGPKHFVPSLDSEPAIIDTPWKFQPVHNVFLLILTEAGILGLVAFFAIIWAKLSELFKKLKNVPRGTFYHFNTDVLYVFIIFSCVSASLFTMFYDHYILDIQQSSLTFWLLIGL